MKELDGIEIRNRQPSDHENVISVMKDWWSGRDLTNMLLKVFFVHFANTTYIAGFESRIPCTVLECGDQGRSPRVTCRRFKSADASALSRLSIKSCR